MTTPTLTVGQFARAGYTDASAALRWATDPAITALYGDNPWEPGELLPAIAATPDPDETLKAVVRCLETATDHPAFHRILSSNTPSRHCLLNIFGNSAILATFITTHPDAILNVTGDLPTSDTIERIILATSPPPETTELTDDQATSYGDALRTAYREALVHIAAADVSHPNPKDSVQPISALLADAATAALQVAYDISRHTTTDSHKCKLAIIALGKCGGRELNYISDVDVMFVVAPTVGHSDDDAVRVGTELAASISRICATPTAAGVLWPVDAGLRPEGNQGPLVRTVSSYMEYYDRWAKTWEFQALLKARAVAGDLDLGQEFVDSTSTLVWQAASRDGFVGDVQSMRRRVEEHIPPGQVDRELKLGPGGLRDIEFCVQMIQLVHGRHDPAVRERDTLSALDALASRSYVGREDAAEFDDCYKFLRALEHRIQLYRLKRNHVMPEDDPSLRRLARSMHLADDKALVAEWSRVRTVVRRVHEKVFYRPVLEAVSRLSSQEARLDPAAAEERLKALGYNDPKAALAAVQYLSKGSERRAQIQRHILPALLQWFADTADPDATLQQFRTISDTIGRTHWYLGLLRDSDNAAERLAHVLGSGKYIAARLVHKQDAIKWLDDDKSLKPRTVESLSTHLAQVVSRSTGEDAVLHVRKTFRQERLRLALAVINGVVPHHAIGPALSDLTACVVDAAFFATQQHIAIKYDLPEGLPMRMAVIGMGRFGGREQCFSSDADAMLVHICAPGANTSESNDIAVRFATALRKALGDQPGQPIVGFDLSLRPEGKQGPLTRSLNSYREYYARWVKPWERQALLRASHAAGSAALADEFLSAVHDIRYPPEGITNDGLIEFRTLKARMEKERLPHGTQPKRHLKMGPGGLADIEWVIQMLQWQHGHHCAALQVPGTMAAFDAAIANQLIDVADATMLMDTWRLLSRTRDAITLWQNRGGDVLPEAERDLEGVARLLGYPSGEAQTMEQDIMRAMRRTRKVAVGYIFG